MHRPGLSINIGGKLMDFSVTRVMGIINATPDSFYAGSRLFIDEDAGVKAALMIEEGADIIDIGACSTRPGAKPVSVDEEYSRIAPVLDAIRKRCPEAVLSVDTFRATIAQKCVEGWDVAIVNDISGGSFDAEMWDTVADLKVAYVLQHMRGTPSNMNELTEYDDVTADVITDLSKKVYQLRGKNICDIIIDPGFGFAKTIGQNFRLLDELDEFCKMGLPLLVGLSRKSMIWKTLGTTAEQSFAGTMALQTIAIERGADIIRVHDVAATRDIVTLIAKLKGDD